MSILNVNKINPVGGGSTITIAGIASVTSSVTAPSFVGAVTGNVTGNVTGDATGLSGNPSINTTGIVTATSFVPTTGQLSHRNLVINGAMNVAQRSASGSLTYGYPSLDRFYTFSNGLDENPTMSQGSLTSSDTPFSFGFRKYLRYQNGNQTSGAGASDQTFFRQAIEGQDAANSGWNYTSSSSFITLSFWMRASVAQTYYGYLKASDGGNYVYPFSMDLSANTWTKITKTIPGNSNLQIDDDTGNGLELVFLGYLGTSLTDNSVSLNTWAAYASGTTRTPDHTTTWYTTNDSTIDITGVQLEVGPVATPFEHRSFTDELLRCQRYYIEFNQGFNTGARTGAGGAKVRYNYPLTVPLRASPTIAATGGSYSCRMYNSGGTSDSSSIPTIASGGNGYNTNQNYLYVEQAGHSSTDDRVASIEASSGISLSAEL